MAACAVAEKIETISGPASVHVADGTHALDWDVRHAVTFTALLHAHAEWSLSWSTRAASGSPWTPVPHATGATPPPFADQTLVNSRRLPWSENTDVAVRWAPKFLFGAKALLNVANLFDQRGDNRNFHSARRQSLGTLLHPGRSVDHSSR